MLLWTYKLIYIYQADATEFVKLANDINSKKPSSIDVDSDLLQTFSYIARGDLCPMQAVIGGIVAQEVMKVCHFLHMIIIKVTYL